MKLTWNQRRALTNLMNFGEEGASSRQCSESPRLGGNYLCGSAARTALMALERKGMANSFSSSPIRYRITDAGRRALEEIR